MIMAHVKLPKLIESALIFLIDELHGHPEVHKDKTAGRGHS